ncbi:uncharacterized protein UHOD_11828 [Ustilago sp. UG-2017b]|nr:uncharacterized protein UHOD_11828 [Ustilago sp. UG-2017b]
MPKIIKFAWFCPSNKQSLITDCSEVDNAEGYDPARCRREYEPMRKRLGRADTVRGWALLGPARCHTSSLRGILPPLGMRHLSAVTRLKPGFGGSG